MGGGLNLDGCANGVRNRVPSEPFPSLKHAIFFVLFLLKLGSCVQHHYTLIQIGTRKVTFSNLFRYWREVN